LGVGKEINQALGRVGAETQVEDSFRFRVTLVTGVAVEQVRLDE
jgi:hypothetical protein